MHSSQSAVLAARKLLATHTPLKNDCGVLCGAACCAGDAQTGMLLFPGEEALYANCGFGRVIKANFLLADAPAFLFVCEGRCLREERPLACRLFPLFLRFGEEGQVRLTLDPRAAQICPLLDQGFTGLSIPFKNAARRAYKQLLLDPECAAYLHALNEALSL